MSEDLARALAAKGSLTITVAGKECTVRPLGLQELMEVERECLERYRRQYLEAYSKNLDLLPDADRGPLMVRKIEEAARWDVENLPHKQTSDPTRVQVTQKLKDWLVEEFPDLKGADDKRVKITASVALDQGMLDEADFERLTGAKPRYTKVGYSNWWITGCFDGMVTFVWVCFRHYGVTREQLVEALRGKMSLLHELVREIEVLSAPQPGNG